MVDLDWGAVQGVGTLVAALIALLAYRASRNAAEEERRYNAAQDAVDAEQGQSIGVLAEAVHKMAELQESHLRALTDRVAELERQRDPANAERRRKERAAEDEKARAELADIGARLEKITLNRRDGLAGGGWSAATMDRKRVIRLTSKRRAPDRKCTECGAALASGAPRCAECGHAVA